MKDLHYLPRFADRWSHLGAGVDSRGRRFPDRRQRVSERDDMFVFGALAHLTELRVIAMLLAPLGITSGRLNVPVCNRANPDIRPSGRYGERSYTSHDLRIGELRAVKIIEVLPNSLRGALADAKSAGQKAAAH